MTTKNFGAGVSAYRDVDGRNFETTVHQASKPVLDSELNLSQEIDQCRNRSILQLAQSGWLGADIFTTSSHSTGIFLASVVDDELKLPPLKALVNGWLIDVANTNGAFYNTVSLGEGPVSGLRTDLVILEVWRCLLSASPSTVGKSQSARIWKNGNVKIAEGNDVLFNFEDDILDVAVGAETTKRVQVQFRLRVIQGVDLDSYPPGIADPTVLAFSAPPDAFTPDGSVTAYVYDGQSRYGDGGLWRAGDGIPTNTLETVDGYLYALPLLAVFRRNTAVFARDTNHNGGSGRPDGLTATIIDARDIMDLRTNISTTGWDLQEFLQKNVNLILDNTLRTELETTPLGNGSKGHTNIWADEIGPTDHPGAQLIRGGPGKGFDSVCRRFSDRPILETIVVKYVPTDQDGGGVEWNSDSVLTIDPTGVTTAFRIHPHGSVNYIAAAPSNIVILDVLNWGIQTGFFDDTAGTGVIRQLTVEDFRQISGLGGTGSITLELLFDLTGTFDLYVTLLVSYPGGAEPTAGGLSRTPTADFGANSFVLETPAQLPATAPYLFDSLITGVDKPHREALISYQTVTQTFTPDQGFETFVDLPADTFILYLPDRVASTPVPVITNLSSGDTYIGPVTFSNCGRALFVNRLAANWSPSLVDFSNGDQVEVTCQVIRPIPINSVQFTIWYETRAAQTIRSALLGTTLTVTPRYIAPYLYTLVTGSGSLDEAYPFPQQYVQSPGVYPSSGGSFTGDHALDGTGIVSISNFSALTGFLQVPTLIPAVPEPQLLTFLRDPGDIDAERRSFFKEVPAGYIPSAFGQPLSDSKRHKNVLPMIAELDTDGPIGPKGTLVVVLLSRWSEFDPDNFVGFNTDLSANFTSASVYRLKGNPLSGRRTYDNPDAGGE